MIGNSADYAGYSIPRLSRQAFKEWTAFLPGIPDMGSRKLCQLKSHFAAAKEDHAAKGS